jgi:hypothetical protein
LLNFTGVFRRAIDAADRATADLVAEVLDGSLDGAFVAGPIDHAELTGCDRIQRRAGARHGAPMGKPCACALTRPNPVRPHWWFRTGCTLPAAA